MHNGSTSHHSTWTPPGIGVFLLCLLLAGHSAWGQTTPGNEEPTDGAPTTAAKPEPAPVTAISATIIPERIESTRAALRTLREKSQPLPLVNQIISQLDSSQELISKSLTELKARDLPLLSARNLGNLELTWQNTRNQMSGFQTQLSEQATALNEFRVRLAELLKPWKKTFDTRDQVQLPGAISDQVSAMIAEIEALDGELKTRIDRVLTYQSSLAGSLDLVDDALARIDQAIALQRKELLKIDAPPLWAAIFRHSGSASETGQSDGDSDSDSDVKDEEGRVTEPTAAEQVESEVTVPVRSALSGVRAYLSANLDRVAAHALLFLILIVLLLYTKSRLDRWYNTGEAPSADAVNLFAYPLATAAFISLAFTRAIYPGAPLALLDINRALLALPLLALLTTALDKHRRIGAYMLIAVFAVDSVTDTIAAQPLAGRLIHLLIAALALTALLWAELRGGPSSNVRKTWRLAWKLAVRAATISLLVAIIANVVGILSLAYWLTNATLVLIYVGLGIFVFSLLARGLLEVLLRSPVTAGLRSLRGSSDAVRRRFNRVLDAAGILLWLAIGLKIFGIFGPTVDAFRWLGSSTLSIGNFTLSVGDVLAFLVALYLGVLISRFLRFILQEDVYPRLRLPRGVPSTINMMVNYGVITIAFLIALAAAGFELGRLAIVAGALSVGIGFGLQAIVNNFVAGLILAFERPIQAGDTIEVGTLLGRVTRIGIRASTLRTYDGSEVIVPNSEFISGQVVNWTLSDITKRQHVPFGVAYGTDPERVMELVTEVANANPLVIPEPEPFVVFHGFGDSSLDFELRAWCNFNDGLQVLTQLNVGINRALADNGIEIPFPQRDLHLRSVDPELGPMLSGSKQSPPAAATAKPAAPASAASQPPPVQPNIPAEPDGSDIA
ncbi:MAG: mechanosensitive ion channel domain-containing protein [Gammaproteobacteria bacterium]